MSYPRQLNLHFVNISSPVTGDAKSSRQQARSHSAREVHAQRRRLRVVNYRPYSAAQEAGSSGVERHDVVVKMLSKDHSLATSSKTWDPGRGLAALFSPLSQLVSDRRDPFACCAMTLTPIDHFLLDHCKYTRGANGAAKNCWDKSSSINCILQM